MNRYLAERIQEYKKLHEDKPYLLPIFLVTASIVLFFIVVVPQFFVMLNLFGDMQAKEEQIDRLSLSYTTLSNMNDFSLSQDYDLVTTAMPNNKDIVRIFTVVSRLALRTGVTLQGFSLEPGNVYSQESPSFSEGTEAAQTLKVDIRLEAAALSSLEAFASQLHEVLPLAEIDELKMVQGQGSLVMRFYYSPIRSEAIVEDYIVDDFSSSERELLNELGTWSNN